jgi:hypothetical protein
MLSFNGLVAVCILYVLILFGVAFLAEKRARRGQGGLAQLALDLHAVAVDLHHGLDVLRRGRVRGAHPGLEFLTIYLGPRWSLSAGSGCCAKWCGSGGRSASPRSPT